MPKGLTVHTIVRNEEQWIWYAINSVIDYVTKLIVYDTGSEDKTAEIIKSIKSKKIIFAEKGEVNPEQLVNLRNEQLRLTKTDWFLVLDGDEVWPEKSIESLSKLLPTLSQQIVGMVVKARLPLGDLFHYQDEKAGRYHLLGRRGHYNIRVYRKLPGYHWKGIYPLEAYCDRQGKAINDQNEKLTYLNDFEYWHLRYLRRTSLDRKVKLEIGKKENILLPEVFSYPRPKIVSWPWVKFSLAEKIAAGILTPLVCIKRLLIPL